MKIAFFGLPLAGLLLARDGHEIVYAGVCRKDAIGTRRLRRVARQVALTPNANSPEVREQVRAAAPDLVVSWFWTKRLPMALVGSARLGGVGVHPSLLPRHRGADPYFWAIFSGDTVTGVTAHALEEVYDTGAVFAQRRLQIDPSWNAWTLAKQLDRPSLATLRELVNAMAAGTAPVALAQDETQATQAPSPDDDFLAIDWRNTAAEVVLLVRAASPWPGATFTLGDDLVILEQARATDDFPKALAPGEAAVRSDGVSVVRAGSSAVELILGRDELGSPIGPHGWESRIAAARGR